MKKNSVIFALFVIGFAFTASVSVGENVFLGVRSGSFASAGGALFFGSHRSNPPFFVGFGTRGAPFFHGRNYYTPPVGAPYLLPAETPHERLSGTDSSGAIYIDGYRVMPSGWLRVQVEPVAAQVLIDGFLAAVEQTSGSTGTIGVPVGSHLIEVLQTGFETYRGEVEVKQAREVVLQITLKQ